MMPHNEHWRSETKCQVDSEINDSIILLKDLTVVHKYEKIHDHGGRKGPLSVIEGPFESQQTFKGNIGTATACFDLYSKKDKIEISPKYFININPLFDKYLQEHPAFKSISCHAGSLGAGHCMKNVVNLIYPCLLNSLNLENLDKDAGVKDIVKTAVSYKGGLKILPASALKSCDYKVDKKYLTISKNYVLGELEKNVIKELIKDSFI